MENGFSRHAIDNLVKSRQLVAGASGVYTRWGGKTDLARYHLVPAKKYSFESDDRGTYRARYAGFFPLPVYVLEKKDPFIWDGKITALGE